MVHSVYFWLKQELTGDQRALFESELKRLPALSYLASGWVAKPAATEVRPVTDHSFDYHLQLEFKSMDDHAFYQSECLDHKRFVDTCKPMFDRVIVYDSERVV
jgi:hypothetical protein